MVMKLAPARLDLPSVDCKITEDANGNITAIYKDQDGKICSVTFVEVTAEELDRKRNKAYPILIP